MPKPGCLPIRGGREDVLLPDSGFYLAHGKLDLANSFMQISNLESLNHNRK